MGTEVFYIILVTGIVIGVHILRRILTRSANHFIDAASDAYQNKRNNAQQEATNSNKREKL